MGVFAGQEPDMSPVCLLYAKILWAILMEPFGIEPKFWLVLSDRHSRSDCSWNAWPVRRIIVLLGSSVLCMKRTCQWALTTTRGCIRMLQGYGCNYAGKLHLVKHKSAGTWMPEELTCKNHLESMERSRWVRILKRLPNQVPCCMCLAFSWR